MCRFGCRALCHRVSVLRQFDVMCHMCHSIGRIEAGGLVMEERDSCNLTTFSRWSSVGSSERSLTSTLCWQYEKSCTHSWMSGTQLPNSACCFQQHKMISASELCTSFSFKDCKILPCNRAAICGLQLYITCNLTSAITLTR